MYNIIAFRKCSFAGAGSIPSDIQRKRWYMLFGYDEPKSVKCPECGHWHYKVIRGKYCGTSDYNVVVYVCSKCGHSWTVYD